MTAPAIVVRFDTYVGPGEPQVFFGLHDHGCALHKACLTCPMAVCVHDRRPDGKAEYGFAGAIRKTWPAGDWPDHYAYFFQEAS